MVRDTHINFLWLLFILVGRICPPSFSLRSKRFRLVSEQKETVEGEFRFWSREKLNENQKMKEGAGGGEGRKRFQKNPSILKTCV